MWSCGFRNGKWNLTLKSKAMHVGRQIDGCEYYMGGSKLVEETLEKDLGAWISADMKCSRQCRYAVNKANNVIGMIKRTITYTDLMVMLNLYKTLVRTHVEYCVSAWSPYYKKDKERKLTASSTICAIRHCPAGR